MPREDDVLEALNSVASGFSISQAADTRDGHVTILKRTTGYSASSATDTLRHRFGPQTTLKEEVSASDEPTLSVYTPRSAPKQNNRYLLAVGLFFAIVAVFAIFAVWKVYFRPPVDDVFE